MQFTWPHEPTVRAFIKHILAHPGISFTFDPAWGWGRLLRNAMLVSGEPVDCWVWEPNGPVELARIARLLEETHGTTR